jgi:hypothetical protein
LLVVALGLQDLPVQRELVLELLMPLLAQVGGDDDQHATLALGPELRQHETGLDGLAQPHLIGQDHTARQRVAAGEQGRFDLVRIEVDLCVHQRRAEGLDAVGVRPPGQFPGKELGLVRRKDDFCRVSPSWHGYHANRLVV